MKILIYEYCNGGGSTEVRPSEGLRNLGGAMLSACIDDCLAANHQAYTIVDHRLMQSLPRDCFIKLVSPGQAFSAFKEMLDEVDAVLPIAPETGGTLSALTALVERSGKLLLGSSMPATRIAGDKFACFKLLARHGYKLPASYPWPVPVEMLDTHGPWILKPRTGAGCEGIYLTDSLESVDISRGEYILQEFISGTHASVAMIAGKSHTAVLSVNLQKMVFDPAPRYMGGAIPLIHPLSNTAEDCARVIPSVIPGLRGYVGVDMVLTDHDVYIIEVNPRVTFTYCGLRRVVSKNLFELILQSARGSDLRDEVNLTGAIEFDDHGRIRELPHKDSPKENNSISQRGA